MFWAEENPVWDLLSKRAFTSDGVSLRVSRNHFGIKCKRNWTGDKVYYDDDAKGECFRSYPSDTSFATHSLGVTGGVYKARERIHRGILIHDY